jgi:beta-mannosidase
VLVNGKEIAQFTGSLVPHEFDLTPHLAPKGNRLAVVFESPPRWLGQFGYTSRMTEWKPRFNYTWDWVSRLVQIGIWDDIFLDVSDGRELSEVRCTTDADVDSGRGILSVFWRVGGGTDRRVRVTLADGERVIHTEETGADKEWAFGSLTWRNLPVQLWWPNGAGAQPLYTLRCELLDSKGRVLDADTRRVGFKHLEWKPCEGAPASADPWLCVVNGKPVFLQGVNWTPILPNFADVAIDDYRKRLRLYRRLGFNLLRVWGGAFLEKQCFYDLCDELGLLVWQEFPLSSSGTENWPPEDETAIAQMADIARSYIHRREIGRAHV